MRTVGTLIACALVACALGGCSWGRSGGACSQIGDCDWSEVCGGDCCEICGCDCRMCCCNCAQRYNSLWCVRNCRRYGFICRRDPPPCHLASEVLAPYMAPPQYAGEMIPLAPPAGDANLPSPSASEPVQ